MKRLAAACPIIAAAVVVGLIVNVWILNNRVAQLESDRVTFARHMGQVVKLIARNGLTLE